MGSVKKVDVSDQAAPEIDFPALLKSFEERSADDPFANPILLFARDVARGLETGTLALDSDAAAVDSLAAAAFRAASL